jgi:hypothetical protein
MSLFIGCTAFLLVLYAAIVVNDAITPAVGVVIGVEAGAVVGAALGALTAQPLPSYGDVVLPEGPPGFYDTWPPGSHAPPIAASTPPPPPG